MSPRQRYAPRFGVDIRVKPDEQQRPAVRVCEYPGCAQPGDHRAPKHRDKLNDYFWFCFDHVREYNLGWDYFRGMSLDDIESYQKNAITGHRPTWKSSDKSVRSKDAKLRVMFGLGMGGDAFRLFDDGPQGLPADRPQPKKRSRSPMQLASLSALNLEPSASWADVKERYKELVKRFHPDANGGDRGAEERLRQVLKAYGQLRSSGFS